uniref:Distal membrane-arm assembly complex protein 1-like domain-containing protein n=1 Tax=Haplochromis burtoni TaxID=8153 RepID=A0A3Q2VYN1_HAPBU
DFPCLPLLIHFLLISMFKSCWSCRLISGGGLILSGAYVFHAARKVMRQGGPTSMGTVAQITFLWLLQDMRVALKRVL